MRGIGKAARKFCKELRRRRAQKIYGEPKGEEEVYKYGDPLLAAVCVEVQRSNSQMILEKKPKSENLIDSIFVKCERAVAKRKWKLRDRIRANRSKHKVRDISTKVHQKSGSVLGLYRDVKVGLKQNSSNENAVPRVKCGSNIKFERLKADPPDPPDPSFSQNNLRIKESPAVERAMASNVHTTGLSTSAKVLVLNSNIVKQKADEKWMDLDSPQTDQPVHWEPPDVQRPPSADKGMELDYPKTDHSLCIQLISIIIFFIFIKLQSMLQSLTFET